MNKIYLVIFSLIVSFNTYCKESRVKLNSKQLKEVLVSLEQNEVLHSSFFEYDAKAVEQNALLLSKVIKKITHKEISKMLKFSLTKLALITSKAKRDENNNNYHLFSMAMIYIVNKYEVGRYNSFSCPMVKKKWIQNSAKTKGVRNPYAPEMKRCGSKDSRF